MRQNFVRVACGKCGRISLWERGLWSPLKEVRILNIFYLEYSVLFIILLAAACKMLKVFLARGRKGEPPEKERS